MRRKPAILLSLLLLLLSLGCAVFHQKMRQHQRLDFREIDTYLRTTDFGDWRFETHADISPHTVPHHTWWSKLGISPRVTVKQDEYVLTHDRTRGTMIISIIRYDGEFERITFSSAARAKHGMPYPEAEDFRNMILFGKFPQLRAFQK